MEMATAIVVAGTGISMLWVLVCLCLPSFTTEILIQMVVLLLNGTSSNTSKQTPHRCSIVVQMPEATAAVCVTATEIAPAPSAPASVTVTSRIGAGIRYAKDRFAKKMLIIVEWNRADIMTDFLEGMPGRNPDFPDRISRGRWGGGKDKEGGDGGVKVARGCAVPWLVMAIAIGIEGCSFSAARDLLSVCLSVQAYASTPLSLTAVSPPACSVELQTALDAALEAAIVSRADRQVDMVKILLDQGADAQIFRVDQRRLAKLLWAKVPELKELATGETCGETSSLSDLEELARDKDVVAARHWMRLLAVRKEAQDARHVVMLMHTAKQNVISRYRRKGEGARQYMDESMAKVAQISPKAVYSCVTSGDGESIVAERQSLLVEFIKMARNLGKVDRLFRDLLGPQFVYKMGMMEPEWDLLLWSVLMNRHQMALFFWQRASQPVVSALTAIQLYRAAMGSVRQEMQDEIETAIQKFEASAIAVQMEAMDEDIRASLEHLECPSLIWGGWTGYDLAVQAGCREFVTQCCRQANDERWYGDINAGKLIPFSLNLGVIRIRFKLHVSVLLLFSAGFFPYFWIAVIWELFSDRGEGPDEAHLPSNSSCFVSLGPLKLRWEDQTDIDTRLVRWLVAAIWLLPLLLLVRWVEWRNPKVSESQRAPGQLRQIPPGYPNEPFNNQGVSLFFSLGLRGSCRSRTCLQC